MEALPYVDNEYEAYKSLVDAMILEEMKTFENPYKLHEIPPLPSNVVKVSATQKSATSTPSSLQVEIAHKAVEYENLTILNEIGANAWKLNCYHLDRLLNHLEFLVAEKQQAISRLNQERKIAQMEAKDQLDRLEMEWQSLVNVCIQLNLAIHQLKSE